MVTDAPRLFYCRRSGKIRTFIHSIKRRKFESVSPLGDIGAQINKALTHGLNRQSIDGLRWTASRGNRLHRLGKIIEKRCCHRSATGIRLSNYQYFHNYTISIYFAAKISQFVKMQDFCGRNVWLYKAICYLCAQIYNFKIKHILLQWEEHLNTAKRPR